VRERHAHAWTLAYVAGQWRDFDTTLSSWDQVEEKNASIFEPFSDWWSGLWFKFSLWRWLGKSRLIARVTALDIILGFMLGSLLSRGITGHASISGTTAAAATLVFLHWVLTFFACRSHRLGTMIKGHSFVLVKDGQVDERAMLHSHISPHDLEEAVRLKGLETIDEVHLAYKERNGEVSVIGRKKSPKILEVSVQDGVQTVRIEIA
jgi:uncharacterized membrane protein YcaP (DUF421 family)